MLVGLLMERFSEKDWHNNLSDFRRCKSRKIWGEWFVIFGIVIEIGVGGWTAKEEWRLSARQADRHISEKQRKDFIKFLENSPKGPVMTGGRHPDSETQEYGNEVYSMLTNAGFTAESRANYSGNLAHFPIGSSVGIFVDNFNDAPAYFANLLAAFRFVGLNPTLFTNIPNRAYSFDEGNPSSNQVMILVVEKH